MPYVHEWMGRPLEICAEKRNSVGVDDRPYAAVVRQLLTGAKPSARDGAITEVFVGRTCDFDDMASR